MDVLIKDYDSSLFILSTFGQSMIVNMPVCVTMH